MTVHMNCFQGFNPYQVDSYMTQYFLDAIQKSNKYAESKYGLEFEKIEYYDAREWPTENVYHALYWKQAISIKYKNETHETIGIIILKKDNGQLKGSFEISDELNCLIDQHLNSKLITKEADNNQDSDRIPEDLPPLEYIRV